MDAKYLVYVILAETLKLIVMEKKIRIARFGSIFSLNLVIKGIIDLILDPVLVIELGYFISLIISTLIYIIVGIISVKIYDHYRTDCLWIEALKETQYNNEQIPVPNHLIRFILKWSKKDGIVLRFLLSLKNTGLMVIYYRDGFKLYNGFTGKNLKLLFLINSFIINLYWYLVLYTGFSLWKFIGTIL